MRVPYLHFIRNSKSRPLFPFPMTWCLLCVFFFISCRLFWFRCSSYLRSEFVVSLPIRPKFCFVWHQNANDVTYRLVFFVSTLYSTLCVVCLRGAREREHQSLFEMYVRERKPKHNHSSAAWITCDLCVTPYVRYCVAVAASAAAGYVFSVDIRLLCGHFSVNAFHQNICICLNDERVTAQCQ